MHLRHGSSPQHRKINIERGDLHTSTWGASITDRAPIILLHDSLGSVELWRDFPAQLAAHTGRSVVAYDRLGFGRSDDQPDQPGMDFIAREAELSLLPVLDQLGIERAILFGHSVGGGMAVAAAAHYPERVVAVVTESAQAFVEEHTLQGIRDAQGNFADPAQLARLARYHGNLPRARRVLDAWIDTWLAPGYAQWTLDPFLQQLQCPLLALHGEGDEFGSVLHPQRIATLAAAGGTCRMIANCGHVPHREQLEAVLATVGGFLQDV